MESRIESPALSVPGVLTALRGLRPAIKRSGLLETTLMLLDLRASQINGCSTCVDLHSRELKAAGEPDERICTVAAWRESSYFSDAERAALELTEASTRLADRADPVPDEVWDEAARHYDEPELAALVVAIAEINAWNRINATTRQITGSWIAEFIQSIQPAGQAAD